MVIDEPKLNCEEPEPDVLFAVKEVLVNWGGLTGVSILLVVVFEFVILPNTNFAALASSTFGPLNKNPPDAGC